MPDTLDILIDMLRMILHPLLGGRGDFTYIWTRTLNEFKSWISELPAPISPLTRNLELLRRLCAAYGDESIRNNEDIKRLIIDGTASEGSTLDIGGVKYKVMGRRITDRGGILYELRDENGQVKQHEFFD